MNPADLFPAIAATWPPHEAHTVGPFIVPAPDPGGNRVSAARLSDANAIGASAAALDQACATMTAQGRAPLFQVMTHQSDLSNALDARGFIARDHTDLLVIDVGALAAVPPPVTAFDIWPPLAIQNDIWNAGGIDAARRAIMDRATCPKTSLFGRVNDQPGGAAYVGIYNDIGMLHALEITPACRRQGLAQHMMRAAAQWAQDNGALWLCVLVTRQNNGAQRLYASLGLKPVGTYVYREVRGTAIQ